METVVLVMMMLVCFNYVLKQTYRKRYAVACSAVVCALFMGLMSPTGGFCISPSIPARMRSFVALSIALMALTAALEYLISMRYASLPF